MAIEITVPRLGWSMEEGTFAGWLKKDGEAVDVGDQLFTLEGEKALQEIESLDRGILRIPADAPKAGEVVKVGQVLAYLTAAGESLPTAASGQVAADLRAADPVVPHALTSAATPPTSADPATPPITPRARRAAAQLGIDPAAVTGTGKGGRIRERDIRSATQVERGDPTALNPVAGQTSPAESAPISALRRTIAERMMRSRESTAPVTLTARADATQLVALRQQFKASGATPVPSYTDIVAKVAAIALRRHPVLAARWEGDQVVLPGAIHLGLAVDTESGLLVPVLRDVNALPLPELARQSLDLVEKARSRRLKPEQLQGGVFTLTNLGGFGIDAFTPIINFPEAAILGLGVIRPEPVVRPDGSVAAREQITLSLSFDHRIVDGAPAAKFLQTLVQGIENPAAWLLAN